MLKKLFFIFAMVGCAKHVPSNAGLYQFAGENFSSTNSPCLDGVLVAIDNSCAAPLSYEENPPYVMIQCEMVRAGASPWNKYNIIALIDPMVSDPINSTIICMDPYARVYIEKRP